MFLVIKKFLWSNYEIDIYTVCVYEYALFETEEKNPNSEMKTLKIWWWGSNLYLESNVLIQWRKKNEMVINFGNAQLHTHTPRSWEKQTENKSDKTSG